MNIKRVIDLHTLLKKKSYFLLGPRQTGKSWLIRENLKGVPLYNLLDTKTFLNLNHSPHRLREETDPKNSVIVIDEIQKLPSLLDEVHNLIEDRGVHFLLTGSSARKLRRGGVNLLGGRARIKHLHPLSYVELKEKFHLLKALNNGLLPSIYFSDEPDEDLKAYVGTYLKEEIAAEGLSRNIPAFSRFLEVAALCNGKLINYANISNDAQIARTTVQEYFQIIEDTLVAYKVPAWKESKKRKPIQTSKFYFFDVGVTRILQNRSRVLEKSPEFGELFESYMFHELKTYVDYKLGGDLCFWRSLSGFEVDFILPGNVAVEIKASATIGPYDLKGLTALGEEKKMKRHILVCLEDRPRKVNQIEVLPWKHFLEKMWNDEL